MAEIDYGPVIAAMRGGTPGPPGAPGQGWVPTVLYQQNLNDVTLAGTYKTTGNTAITLANNYPLAAVAGTLEVQSRILSGEPYGPSCVQEFVPFFGVPNSESRMVLRRTLTGGIWQPWRSYTSQRVDNTAGRAIYTWDDVANREQLIYGDTGTRLLNPETIATPVVSADSTVLVSRNGTMVSVQLNRMTITDKNTTGEIIANFGVGFRPLGSQAQTGLLVESGGNLVVPGQVTNSGALRAWWTVTTGILSGTISFRTQDPWPTTLPGTAYGSVPA